MPFPPVPGPRQAYDRDGTVGTVHDGTHAPTQLTQGNLVTLNNESDAGDLVLGTNTFICLLFPEIRDIIAFGARFSTAGTYVLQSSVDTTTGLDGVWTTNTASLSNTAFDPAGAANRTTFTTQNIPGVTAVRFNITGMSTDTTAYGIHLYSQISAGQTLDRLDFCDQFSNPLPASYFDQGDVAQSSSATQTFYLINRSNTRTASNINIFAEALTDTTPSVAAQYLFSLDNTNFTSSMTIPSLGPGGLQQVWVRRVTPSNAILSVWTPRIVARAGGWA